MKTIIIIDFLLLMTIGFILINYLLTLGDGMNVSSDLLLQFYVQRFLQCVIHQLSFFLNVKNKKPSQLISNQKLVPNIHKIERIMDFTHLA